MIEEHVHPWDRAGVAKETSQPAVLTTPEQVLSGLDLGVDDRVSCTSCGALLRAGDAFWVFAYRAAEATEWSLTRWSCPDCHTESIDTPTLGTSEILVEARLGEVSGAGEYGTRLSLSSVRLRAFSPMREGSFL